MRAAPRTSGASATVVTKLLCMVLPDIAYFGQKDAQQVVVIRRLVADLNLPVHVEACHTVREPDGLAMSSRNALLSPTGARRARSPPRRALRAAARRGLPRRALSRGAAGQPRARRCRSCGVEPEYLALVDPDTLEPHRRLQAPALLAVAARIGEHPPDRQRDLASRRTVEPRHDQPQGEATATCSA